MKTLVRFPAAALAVLFCAAAADAACLRMICHDLGLADGGCKIRLRNHIGLASGSGGGDYNQVSRAKTIRVVGRDAIGPETGNVGPSMKILAGDAKNFDLNHSERGFANILRIKIDTVGGDRSIDMSCKEAKRVMNGSKTCKVFFLREGGNHFHMYSCNGNSLYGPLETSQ